MVCGRVLLFCFVFFFPLLFSKQSELTYKVYIGQQQNEWIPAPACQILEICRAVLTEFSHIYCVGVLNTTLLKAGSLEQPVELVKACGTYIPETREGIGSLGVPGPGHLSTGSHIFSATFPRIFFNLPGYIGLYEVYLNVQSILSFSI